MGGGGGGRGGQRASSNHNTHPLARSPPRSLARSRACRRGIDAASGASKGTSVEVRVNNGHGGYKLIQQTVAEGTTREDMLYLRTSKKSDKFC